MKTTKPLFETAWNEAKAQIVALIGAANEATSEDGWVRVPYGEHGNEANTTGRCITQVLDQESAAAMVGAFNSLGSRLLRGFRGLPIYVGHPDSPAWVKSNAPIYDRHGARAVGRVLEMDAREDGLYFRQAWNEEGRTLTQGEAPAYAFTSPHWGMRPVTGKAHTFRPVELRSLGLTNNPQIDAFVTAMNEEAAIQEGDTMPKWLIELLGLDAAANEEQAQAKLQAILDELAGTEAARESEAAARASEAAATEKMSAAEKQIADKDTEIAAANERIAALEMARREQTLTVALGEGRITEADRAAWNEKLAGDFDAAAAELGKLEAALNTRPLNIGARKGEAMAGVSAINEAVRGFAKANNLDPDTATGWDAAFAGARRANPALFGAKEAGK